MGTATGKSRVVLTVAVALHYMCVWGDPAVPYVIYILCLNKWLRDRDFFQNDPVIKELNIKCHYVESIEVLKDHEDLTK